MEKLIKKIFSGGEYEYTLHLEGEVGIYAKSGVGHGWHKLSKQNCDEIFGVVNVEKLKSDYIEDQLKGLDKEGYEKYFSFAEEDAKTFIEGFNKAMELDKDKVFTLEDMRKAYFDGYNDKEENKFFNPSKSLQQPTEIEVEIEMETCSMNPLDLDCDEIVERPKLDSIGCLILKKI